MPNRMLRDCTASDNINKVSPHAEVFFYRLMMKADDYGSFYANVKLIKASCFPLKLDTVRDADIQRWIAECKKAGLIVIYTSDGKEYLRIINFGQRLRNKKNKFPDCPQHILITGGESQQPAANGGELRPEVEVEVEVEVENEKEKEKPNGLGEATASPPAKILYSSIEKTVMGIYEFLQTKPDVPDAYKDYWNLFAKAKGLACIDKISDSRKRKLNVRMRDKNFDFTTILKTAGKSEFLLKGKWFSFDWIIENDSNYLKVIEGNYEKKEEETTLLSNQQNQNLSAAVRAIEGVV